MRIKLLAVLIAILVAHVPARTLAWCYKEHIQFARLAAERIIADPSTPPEFKRWLEEAMPNRLDSAGEQDYFLHSHLGMDPKGFESGILHWTYMPDARALDKTFPNVQPFNQHEAKMHYIDMELFVSGSAPRKYLPDLSSKPPIENFPNDPKDKRYEQAGYLPLRIAQIYGELVKALRENRLHPTSPTDENNAEVYAGYLAHYLGDNTQPQHATIDFRSATYFNNMRKAPNAHAAVEYMMCDDETDYPELRKEFWTLFTQQLDLFTDPIQTDDLFKATLQIAEKSYDNLPLIGEAAAKSAKKSDDGKTTVIDCADFFHYHTSVHGQEESVMQMKARQTAWAVKRIERVWKQAWKEATAK